jgi:hypothetical protein
MLASNLHFLSCELFIPFTLFLLAYCSFHLFVSMFPELPAAIPPGPAVPLEKCVRQIHQHVFLSYRHLKPIILSVPLKCWDYRFMLLCLFFFKFIIFFPIAGTEHRALHIFYHLSHPPPWSTLALCRRVLCPHHVMGTHLLC